jgi:tetratricopeptide (TPR) repeat protein
MGKRAELPSAATGGLAMATQPLDEEAIFQLARKIESPDGRAGYLEQVCGDNPPLRARVQALLDVQEQDSSFLRVPAAAIVFTVDDPITERPGTVIGPYKLMEQIGEGGMGLVFVAEQQHPVRRQVALKVLKPGMDTRQVVARFEAERQALALMDHPHIAQVFDGGTTPAGRPYFVMELVKGVPITDFCDHNHLPIRARLELFLDVCAAVQHAHQKGVIHRDLKPSNVLVVSHDGTPMAKVIDFGIAKAVGQHLTDKTIYTQLAQLIGTPLYMSPEQAGQSGLDIDTRSDIYALGVLLYELLTGRTPFDPEQLRTAGYDELRRIIREEEPPRPSTRISTLGQAATTASTNRKSDPKQLSRLFRGELDWIVMKCLEKDRNRRYETASAIAADVLRYLRDEPVQACPPSVGYRLGKFARRHKAALTIAAVVAVAGLLTLAGVGGSVGWVLRDKEAQRAATEEVVGNALQESRRLQRQGRWPQAHDAARRAQDLLARGQGSESLARQVRQQLADLDMVETLENICLGMRVRGSLADQQQADRDYAQAFRAYGIEVEAVEPAVAINRLKASAIGRELARALDDWALACRDIRKHDGLAWKRLLTLAAAVDPDEGRRAIRDAWKQGDLKALASLADSASPALLQVPTVDLLADALYKTGAAERAVALLRKAQQGQPGDFWINYLLCFYLGRQKSPGGDAELRFAQAAVALRSENAMAHNLLGGVLLKRGNLDEAVAEYQRAITLDPRHAWAHNNLGKALNAKGKLDQAIESYQKAIAIDAKFAWAHSNLGLALAAKGKGDEAIECYHRAIALDPKLALAHSNLGIALKAKGKLDQAIACYHQAIALDPRCALAYSNLGVALKAKGKLDQAFDCCHKAIALDPKLALAHTNLGGILHAKGKLDEGIECFKNAIAIDPRFAPAHYNLGVALADKGKEEEAIESYHKAIALDPKHADAHTNLGNTLKAKGMVEEAIDCYHKAIASNPRHTLAHYNLGVALADKGKVDEAISRYHRAVALDPRLAPAHRGLGQALMHQGEIIEAQKSLRRCLALLPPSDPLRGFTGQLLGQCEQWLDAEDKLKAYLAGQEAPAEAAAQVQMADLAQQPFKGLYVSAARLYRDAFARQSGLAAAHRYNAACAAALAGCGQGKDATTLDGKERARLRRQALAWLRADLEAWRRLLDNGLAGARPVVRGQMSHWLADTDFAGVRGPDALARLPEAERPAWQKLWSDVADTLDRARKPDGK